MADDGSVPSPSTKTPATTEKSPFEDNLKVLRERYNVRTRERQILGQCIATRDANGNALCLVDATAKTTVFSRKLSDKAKEGIENNPSELEHKQKALNEAVDTIEFYRKFGYDHNYPTQEIARSIRPSIANYNRIQNGGEAITMSDAPMAFLSQFGSTVKDIGKGTVQGVFVDTPNGIYYVFTQPGDAAKAIKDTATHPGDALETAALNADESAAQGTGAVDLGRMYGGVLAGEGLGLATKTMLGKFSPLLGEPVSVATGEYLETWRDFLVPGTLSFDGSRYMGMKLGLPTRYLSPLGPCQISVFDEIFSNPARGELMFHSADGKRIGFERPFSFLPSVNSACPHLELKAPWLKQLELRDGRLTKHFRQYGDGFYRLDKIAEMNGFELVLTRDAETGMLNRVEGPDGLALAFENDGKGRRLGITLIGADGTAQTLVRYAYDHKGRMVSADCAFGMSVRYEWQARRDLIARWHNQTRRSETTFTYDAEGRVIHTATNGIWNDDRFRYDSEHRQTIYLPAGEEARAQRFDYDAHENVTAEIDALGGIVVHRYDADGFRISTTDPLGHETVTRYDARGRVKETLDAEGRASTYFWGDCDELFMVADGEGNKKQYEHDDHANVICETDAEGHSTRFERNERGLLTKTIFADGTEESRAYDGYGRLAQIRDAKGGLTRFAYDVFGRLVERVNALGGVTKLDYEAGAGGFATPTRLTRPDGVSIGRRFDAEGSLASVSDGEGRSWNYRFGAFEVLEAITDPKGGELSFSYDSEGRLIAVTNAMGRVYSLNRDVAGRVVEEEDFDGRVVRYRRDAAGRVIETIKPDGGRLVYGYDKTDRITRIETFAPKAKPEDAPQDVTRFWYDGRGLVIKAENGASLVEYERDKNGAIVAETVNGRRVEVKLDAMGRRTERRLSTPKTTNPGESLVAYSRDPLGLIESLTINGHASLSFQHDALGREIRRSSPAGFQLTSRHDAVGQLIEQSGGGDPAERMRQAAFGEASSRSASPAIERRYRWDRANSPLAILDGLWGETTYEYDANGQVAATKAGEGTGDELRERFEYDAARNLVGTAAAGAGKLHGFGEAFGKLTAWANTPGGVVRIARGPFGERLALNHDACGRVTERKVERNGFRLKVWRYEWDGHDRLVKCITPEGDIWRYGYDPFGRRVWKVRELTQAEARSYAGHFSGLITVDQVTPDYASSLLPPPSERRGGLPGQSNDGREKAPIVGVAYSWDGDVIAEEAPLRLDGAIDWHRATRWHYEPGSFRPLAKHEAPQCVQHPDGNWQEDAGTLLYVVTDHLGMPREMIDERGKVQWAVSYTTWGLIRGVRVAASQVANADYSNNCLTQGSTVPRAFGNLMLKAVSEDTSQACICPIRFQGQWQDEETGLYYNRHRYYDPFAGQYTGPDAIGLEGGDRPHGYVTRPSSWVDPLGLAAEAPLYRVIRPDENPDMGLVARNPNAAYTPTGHVLNGSKPGWASQFISTTKDLDVARKWAEKTGNRIIAIQPSKVQGIIIDTTQPGVMKGVTAKNFSNSSQEVLIQGVIPKEAISILK